MMKVMLSLLLTVSLLLVVTVTAQPFQCPDTVVHDEVLKNLTSGICTLDEPQDCEDNIEECDDDHLDLEKYLFGDPNQDFMGVWDNFTTNLTGCANESGVTLNPRCNVTVEEGRVRRQVPPGVGEICDWTITLTMFLQDMGVPTNKLMEVFKCMAEKLGMWQPYVTCINEA